MVDPIKLKVFSRQLLEWHRPSDRPMPWKEKSDIYSTWISEIMLQQTRVEQAIPYFNRFVEKFPNLGALASATEDEVLEVWQGLGYYSRARNLLKAAKLIDGERGGKFPVDFDSWLEIPGVGSYTAAAITSFAFGQPNAVVDGNVYRVLSRYFGIYSPIDQSGGKKEFAGLANQLIAKAPPDKWNQAIMDFGATICKPAVPLCTLCPVQNTCFARNKDVTHQLPVKAKAVSKKDWELHYLHLHSDQKMILKKRPSSGIWGGLYEFPVVDHPVRAVQWLKSHFSHSEFKFHRSVEIRHQLTHKNIRATFHQWEVNPLDLTENDNFVLVDEKNLPIFAVHSLMLKYFTNFTH